MGMAGMKFMAKGHIITLGFNKHGHYFQPTCKMVLGSVASNYVSFCGNRAFYCLLVHEESLIKDVQSCPYRSNSKQLGPGRMLLSHWKLLLTDAVASLCDTCPILSWLWLTVLWSLQWSPGPHWTHPGNTDLEDHIVGLSIPSCKLNILQ